MNSSKCRVLCVDDHEDTCFMLSALLGSAGHEVSTADSVAAAKRSMTAGHSDLVVMDKRFADGSGVNLCEWARGHSPQTPVIFYSGAALESDREQGLCAGASAYITKPDIRGLEAEVSRQLQDKGCAAAPAAREAPPGLRGSDVRA